MLPIIYVRMISNIILGSNSWLYNIWNAGNVFYGLLTHSGHDIKGLDETVRHVMHHKKVMVNFGPTGLCDFLYNTEYIEKKKNK